MFSKRRVGLFKKACELCMLCGAKIAIAIISPDIKVFSSGHPRVEISHVIVLIDDIELLIEKRNSEELWKRCPHSKG